MIGIKFEIDYTPFKKALQVIEDEFVPTRTKNKQVSESIRRKMVGYFNQGGQAGDGGSAWRPLSQSRIFAKEQNKNVILVEFGKLKSSFLSTSDNKFASVKNAVPYAAQHQRGFDNTPARPMIPQRSSLQKTVERVYFDNLRKRLGQL